MTDLPGTSDSRLHLWPAVLLTATGYAIVNGLGVFLPFIPGQGTLVFWGMIMPLLFIAGSWTVLAQGRRRFREWWIAGIISTVIYAGLGFGSASIIVSIWGAI